MASNAVNNFRNMDIVFDDLCYEVNVPNQKGKSIWFTFSYPYLNINIVGFVDYFGPIGNIND